MGILAEAAFAVQSVYHRTNKKTPRQIVFGQEIKLPINHVAGWRYIRQRKQAQIEKSVIR